METRADPLVYWTAGAATALVVLAVSVVRIVPAGQCLVLLRFGAVSGVRGPGLIVVLPLLRQGLRVPTTPHTLDLLWLEVVTRDGVPVTVSCTATAVVRDPAAYAGHVLAGDAPDTDRVAADVIVTCLARRRLADIARADGDGLARAVTTRTRSRGIEVTDVEVARAEVPLGPELFRWAHPDNERQGGQS
ncbi:SPFH domain-containing protein [Amycolatopsis suaedae]|uniref:SPFH domain-containing protein n=1 Tax=Amycolatopsis suaedae TaxID=2510978 RepID=UPI0013EEFD8B|nr:SPFH domain-containing protein [Amycolatopsis suaedae]